MQGVYEMSLPILQLILLLLMGLLLVVLALWCVGRVLDALEEPVQDPERKLIGQAGRVVAPVYQERGGKVLVLGEIWDAILDEPSGDSASVASLAPDALVRVVGFDSVDPRTVKVVALQ